MFELLGICLALSGLLALHVAAMLLAALWWRGWVRRAQMWPARRRAHWLFALRVLPGALALLGTAFLLLPAYWRYEPRQESAEEVGFKLGAFAVVSAVGLSWAMLRRVAAWRATRRITRAWLRASAPLALAQAPVPAFRLRHAFPVVAVVGVLRPRLFIAEQILQTLTADELNAALAHECGHLAARDNLKRGLMRACSDALLFLPGLRRLEAQWAAAAEEAADHFAARQDKQRALDLASALIKIARLIPADAHPALPAGALLLDDSEGVARRVRLLADAAVSQVAAPQSPIHQAAFWLTLSALSVAALWLAVGSLEAIHHLIETVVASLR